MSYFLIRETGISGGEEVSARSVQSIIADIVKDEPVNKPYSDETIRKILGEKHDIDISRRTVAKYRSAAGIPSALQRA